MLKQILKIAGFITLGTITTLMLLFFLIKIGVLNKIIAQTVSNQINKSINGKLSVEALNGDVFSEFTLLNLQILQGNDTIMTCDTISIKYTLTELINRTIIADKIKITNLKTYITQQTDSNLNWANLVPPANSIDKDSETTNWKIEIRDLQLRNFITKLNLLHKTAYMPEYLKSDIRCNFTNTTDSLYLNIHSCSVMFQNPDINLNLKASISKSKNILKWYNLALLLENTPITSAGQIELDKKRIINSKNQYFSFADF